MAWGLGYLFADNLSDQILFAGTALQLFGLVVVWLGIRGVRQTFGSESEFAAMIGWVEALRASFRRRNASVIVGSAGVSVGAGGALAYGRNRGATIESRVELLENEVDVLRQAMHTEDARLKAAISALKQELKNQAHQLESADHAIRKEIKDLAVGQGVTRHLGSIGFWWVVFATFATCVPGELVKLAP